MRFTLFQCKGEIGHQHKQAPLAATISGLTRPTQPMNHEIARRPDQHTGNHALPLVCGFFNVPRGYEH